MDIHKTDKSCKNVSCRHGQGRVRIRFDVDDGGTPVEVWVSPTEDFVLKQVMLGCRFHGSAVVRPVCFALLLSRDLFHSAFMWTRPLAVSTGRIPTRP